LRQLKVSRSTTTFASISGFLAVVVLGYAFTKLDGTNPEDQPVPSSDQALPTNEQTVPTSDQAAPTSSQDVSTTPPVPERLRGHSARIGQDEAVHHLGR